MCLTRRCVHVFGNHMGVVPPLRKSILVSLLTVGCLSFSGSIIPSKHLNNKYLKAHTSLPCRPLVGQSARRRIRSSCRHLGTLRRLGTGLLPWNRSRWSSVEETCTYGAPEPFWAAREGVRNVRKRTVPRSITTDHERSRCRCSTTLNRNFCGRAS